MIKSVKNHWSRKWTKELILRDAAKYTYKHEWQEKSYGAYQAAHRLGIRREVTKLLKDKVRKKTGPYHWTKQKVFEEAAKYTYKDEWSKKSPRSYHASWRLGIRREVSKLLKNKIRKKTEGWVWNKKAVLEDAKKYTILRDWNKANQSAVHAARLYGWFNEASAHMTRLMKPPGYYSKDRLISIAKKYKHSIDWMNNDYNTYARAIQKYTSKDKEIFGHLKTKAKPIRKWTKENVLKDALKYSYQIDWRRANQTALELARDRGWLKEATKHMKMRGTRFKRCLYSIRVKNKKIIYFGLTFRFERRIKDHLESKRFMELKRKYGSNCLEVKKLTDYIDVKTAQKLEIKLINKMKDRNFILLNIQKGGGIGGSEGKWTPEKILNTAKKYSTKAEWREKDSASMASARSRPDIFKQAVKHMVALRRLKKWTKEAAIEDAKKYNSRSEWSANSKGYEAARSGGYLNEATKHMKIKKRPKWTSMIDVINDAKKYSTRTDWYKNSPGAYVKAREGGYVDEAIKHMKIIKKYWKNKELFDDAKKYKTRTEWDKASPNAPEIAESRGIYKEVTKHMVDGRSLVSKRFWTDKKILDDAKKYNSRLKWSRTPAGMAAQRFGIYKEAVKHMPKYPKRV